MISALEARQAADIPQDDQADDIIATHAQLTGQPVPDINTKSGKPVFHKLDKTKTSLVAGAILAGSVALIHNTGQTDNENEVVSVSNPIEKTGNTSPDALPETRTAASANDQIQSESESTVFSLTGDLFDLQILRKEQENTPLSTSGISATESGAGQGEDNLPAYNERIQYRVKPGDTLWGIASRLLGDPYLYPEIARINDIKNPDLIFPDDLIVINIKNSQA